jgi:predicted metal-dependent HD superfamily phosphohydrolase
MSQRLKTTFIELVSAHWDGTRAAPVTMGDTLEELWQEIASAYTKRRRYYHTLHHLDNMLGQLEEVRPLIGRWEVVLFSLYYHDIVYNPLRKDNEEKSAELAGQRLVQLGVDAPAIVACREQILATKAHDIRLSPDTNYFTDADLSILGAEAAVYDAYARDVRKEYAIYPDIVYKPGRKKVLEHFLAMKRIYKTDHFFGRLEQKARENLRRELEGR